MRNLASRSLGPLMMACAIGWAGASFAADNGPSAKEIQQRLLGTGETSAPTSKPDCSTQEALENNPACFNQVSGGERSFSLIAPGAGAKAAKSAPSSATAKPSRTASAGPGARGPIRHASARAAAGGCDLGESANTRGANLCVTFGLNSAVLTPQSRTRLDRLAEALNAPEIRGRMVRIEGYADVTGDAEANQKLSEERAQSVVEYLAQHGVQQDHLTAKGYGASHFLPGRSPTDPSNRRVEATLADQS